MTGFNCGPNAPHHSLRAFDPRLVQCHTKAFQRWSLRFGDDGEFQLDRVAGHQILATCPIDQQLLSCTFGLSCGPTRPRRFQVMDLQGVCGLDALLASTEADGKSYWAATPALGQLGFTTRRTIGNRYLHWIGSGRLSDDRLQTLAGAIREPSLAGGINGMDAGEGL